MSVGCDPGAFRTDVQASDRKDASAAGRASRTLDAGDDASRAGSSGHAHAGSGGVAGGGAGRHAPVAAGGGTGGAADAGEGGPTDAAGSGGAAGASCSRSDKDAPVQLVGMQEVGTVMQPAGVGLRVPGPIAWVGGSRLVWLFPKSMLTVPAVSGAPPNHPSAAFVARKEPTKLDERTAAGGAPLAFLPVQTDHPELELWPTALLRAKSAATQAASGGVAIVQRIAADFSYEVLSTPLGSDELAAPGPLTPLFSGNDPKFSLGGFSGETYGYLYACEEDASVADRGDFKHFPCKVARAPLTQLGQRDRWETHGEGALPWLSDLSAGKPVIYGPSNTLSVSYNRALDRYLGVHSRWFSNEIIIQSAAHPMGPWRVELTLDAPPPVEGVAQFALEQPSLKESDCDTAIWISYMAPRAMNAGFPSQAEIKLLRVELK